MWSGPWWCMPIISARGSRAQLQPELCSDTLQCSQETPSFQRTEQKVDYDKPEMDTQLQKYISTNPFETRLQEINSESRHLKEKGLSCGATVKIFTGSGEYFSSFPGFLNYPKVLTHTARSPPERRHTRPCLLLPHSMSNSLVSLVTKVANVHIFITLHSSAFQVQNILCLKIIRIETFNHTL